ncbi:ribonuclease H-like domain-containing protein [Tanacetum coccineum]
MTPSSPPSYTFLDPTPSLLLHRLFKHKFHVNGTLIHYKACLVANGNSYQLGVDFDETFSPIVKAATIRTVHSFVVFRTSFSPVVLHQIIDSLHSEFDMTDLGALNYFLGISAIRHHIGLFLSQRKNALQLLERVHMVNCNHSRTLVDTEPKLGPEGVCVQDPTLYRSLAGGYNISRLHVQICLMQYIKFATLDFGLHLYASTTTSLVGYTDADWTGCPSTRMSTSGYCVFLGDNLLSCFAKRQHTLSRSSAEAEYRGVANVVAETAWLHNLFVMKMSRFVVSAAYTKVNAVGMKVTTAERLQLLEEFLLSEG